MAYFKVSSKVTIIAKTINLVDKKQQEQQEEQQEQQEQEQEWER